MFILFGERLQTRRGQVGSGDVMCAIGRRNSFKLQK